MLFAFFGLGLGEIIVLGLCCVPVAAAAIIVPVVLMMTRSSPARDKRPEPEDSDRPSKDEDAREKGSSDQFKAE